MNIITQEARKRQAVVKYAVKNGKSAASRQYGVSLSSVKRWCLRYDGNNWQSLCELSHRPHSNPNRHTASEERKIKKAFKKCYARYGWDGVYDELIKRHYTRSFSGMVYAAKRIGLTEKNKIKKPPRKTERRYLELTVPGEKVQIDVKEVPFNCLRGDALKYGKRLYQWTAIDECTRIRFVYAFEEHTPENTVKFLNMLIKAFPFKIQTIQTDNGTEFTYKFISDTELSPLINDEEIDPDEGIIHQDEGVDLIPANIELSGMDLALVISRLGRSTKDLLNIIDTLTDKGVTLISHKENIDTDTPAGKFMLTVFAALSQLEREQLKQRQREGIEIAKAQGKYTGRKPIEIDWTRFGLLYGEWKSKNITGRDFMRRMGLSANTFYRRVREYEAEHGIAEPTSA